MARRTATVVHLQYSKKYSRGEDKWKDVAALPDGDDLLTFVMGVWNGLKRKTLYDNAKQRSCEPLRKRADGRAITLTANVGTFGEPAQISDINTGKVERSHNGELVNMIPLRIVILVPTRATSALMFIEHATASAPFGGSFLEHLKLCWAQYYPEWTLRAEGLTRPDAWLANAELQAVEARVYRHKVAQQNAGQPDVVGVMKSVLEPVAGTSVFPRWVLEGLTGRTAKRGAFLGMNEEPDEVRVTLGDGDQQKTFVLGNERTPPVRLLVTDWGTTALDDQAFRDWCVAEADTHFKAVDAHWDRSMIRGKWSSDDLDRKVVLSSGG